MLPPRTVYSEPKEAPKPPSATFEGFSKLGLELLCALALSIGPILLG
jgi:hypothetical protein